MAKQLSQSEIHRFFCTSCGNEGIPISRKRGKKRGYKHLKKLYCIFCGTETNHCEISPSGIYQYEDFIKDFSLNKFKER